MKNLFSVFILFIFLTNGYSQHFDFDFETYPVELQIDSNSIWQLGQPSKTILNSSYSGSKAMITDSSNMYPASDTSSFIINFSPLTCLAPDISFYHKYDTDSAQDGGYIEYSVELNDAERGTYYVKINERIVPVIKK